MNLRSDEPSDHVYVVHAQALVEAVASYEAGHPPGTPCFFEALTLMTTELTP